MSETATDSRLVEISKFLSLVLRHKPEAIGLALDAQGWAALDELLMKSNAAGTLLSRNDVLRVIQTSEKKRFTLSDDGQRIRAAQGHSVAVDLGLVPREPPAVLYHGTATRFLDRILAEGLKPQGRQQVHLSADQETARRVGQRHGKPVVLQIDARRMQQAGFEFFLAENGVWLTSRVPQGFIFRHRH
jgi:putative RNA 2'-phosphotransferase